MEITALDNFPYVLLAWGNEFDRGDNRAVFLDNIDSTRGYPVHNGTFDFLIVYSIPDEGGSEHAYEDMNVRPRPRRGAIRMDGLPPDSRTMPGHIHKVLQEIGHHWLAYGDRMTFRLGSEEITLPTDSAIADYINDGIPFYGSPIIIGRQNQHWSSFFQADRSPMDGLSYQETGEEAGYVIWTALDQPFYSSDLQIAPDGLNPINMLGFYCDLDKLIMGTITNENAYTFRDNKVKWIEPKLIAPLEYRAGLLLMFDQNDFVFFGFDQHHRKLTAYRIGIAAQGPVTIDDYAPLEHDYNGLALRIVKRGNTYYFQAKKDNPLSGCSSLLLRILGKDRSQLPNFFEDLDDLLARQGVGDMSRYRTVFQQDFTGVPQAIGTVLIKWSRASMVEATFYNLEILQQGGKASQLSRTTLRTDSLPTVLPRAFSFESLNENTLYSHVPNTASSINPTVESKGGRIHLKTILDNLFDLNQSTDQAPKLLAKAPDGDFAFGSLVNIHRSCFTPWAAGYAWDKSIWGKEMSVDTRNILLKETAISRQPPPPPNNVYRVLFVVTASSRNAITEDYVRRVDNVRRYFDEAFNKATNNLFYSDSRIVAAV